MAIEKLKTKFVTGAFVNDVKHFFKKINEIIDWINNVGSTTVPNYKVYRALLNQSGTDAPVATVLENTLGGTVVWTRANVGLYEGTLTGAFTSGKTICPQFPCLAFETNGTFLPVSTNGNPQLGWINAYCQDENTFTISTLDLTGHAEWSTILGSSFLVEIIVYN